LRCAAEGSTPLATLALADGGAGGAAITNMAECFEGAKTTSMATENVAKTLCV